MVSRDLHTMYDNFDWAFYPLGVRGGRFVVHMFQPLTRYQVLCHGLLIERTNFYTSNDADLPEPIS
ncbi:BQ2448_1256 [Microbotryum intermedium]|uniref:BQ2448_1256 protein n=1 Tax=Microbotryum intermedium TaxID=269621 RepID=A0A238F7L8_9BASI|nr:BQ2448_1256 [Microbotryum intermedium]